MACLPARAQLVETNVALNKPTSGDVAFGYPTSNGNDGSVATFNHADNVNPAPNTPFWAVDLQGEFDLMRIEIVDRIGCCDPNRLNGSEIRVFDIGGAQIGETLSVNGYPPSSPDETTATITFDNAGAGWPGAASVRIDGFVQYFQFSEFRAFALAPPTPINVAPFGAVSSSGPTYNGQPAAAIIDGNAATNSHPAAGPTLGFTYTLNLFRSFQFESLEILNRNNCCPERLSNYRVSIHQDDGSGSPGAAVWSTDLHTDGSNSGIGGVDILTSDMDPTGTFAGQYVRVENLSGIEYNPQIAELRAFAFYEPLTHLATGKPVGLFDALDTPADTWGGFPATNLTDGKIGTISHPQAMTSSGYYYQIDLESDTAIGTIALTGRIHDGCCPERLNDARIEVWNDAGSMVFQQVAADQVTDPVEIAVNATGRYVRIINADSADYAPQLSEVVVLPPSGPGAPFQITELAVDTVSGNGTITFNSTPGTTYSLFGSNDLAGWAEIMDSIIADSTSAEVDFYDVDLKGADVRYYRIEVSP